MSCLRVKRWPMVVLPLQCGGWFLLYLYVPYDPKYLVSRSNGRLSVYFCASGRGALHTPISPTKKRRKGGEDRLLRKKYMYCAVHISQSLSKAPEITDHSSPLTAKGDMDEYIIVYLLIVVAVYMVYKKIVVRRKEGSGHFDYAVEGGQRTRIRHEVTTAGRRRRFFLSRASC